MSAPPVALQAVTKRYGRHEALRGVTLNVERGSLLGLIGPNGAGKTTTFGVLCGWLRADGGSASLLGVPPAAMERLRGRVGVMPQDSHFPPALPIVRQLQHFARLQGLPRDTAEREAERVLHEVGLWESRTKKGSELSHGMLKRAALAQALLGQPELLLLDEPTNGLDPEHRRRVLDLLVSLRGKATVVVSSHLLGDLEEICTHVAILVGGVVQATGRTEELTRAGRRMRVRVDPGQTLPMETLHRRFGADNLRYHGGLVEVTRSEDDDAKDAFAALLRVLLDGGVDIQDAQRGVSLEEVFLSATQAGGGLTGAS